MNRMAHQQSKEFNPLCPDFMTTAERELSAFFNAIARLFGSEQAEISANDWLEELMETDGLPASTRDWRVITVKAATRLARRVKASSLSESSILSERMFV